MSVIKTLKQKDENGLEQSVYPKTTLKSVVDPETNKTLDVILDELNNKIDNIEVSGGTPVENLLVYPYAISNETTDNYTIIDNGDGTLTISCNFPELSMANVQIVSEQPISAGTYIVSGCSENFTDSTVNINVYVDDTSGNRIHYGNVSYGQNFTFTVTELCYLSISLWFNSGASLTDAVLKPMLELGTVAHDYKPYKDVSVLPKTGGTIDGDLMVEGTLGVPMLADNTGDDLVPVPIAGAIETEETSMLVDTLPNIKSYMGSFYGKSADSSSSSGWHNVMSVRHRNGAGDGGNYGMYIRSNMADAGSLLYNKQYNGNWQGEKVILDSINYNQYALPLSGGTVTGLTKFNGGLVSSTESTQFSQDYYVHTFGTAGSSTGYLKFATIVTNNTYIGGVLKMTIHTRTKVGNLIIDFNGASTEAGASITNIRQTGNLPQIYAVKTATRTWDLYIKKMAYESGTVSRIDTSYYLKQRLTITWYDTYVASLPTGATPATVTNEWSGVVTASDESGSVSFTMKAGCSYLISVRHITQGTMYATGIIVATPSSWAYHSIGGGGSTFHSMSGSTFTYGFGSPSTLAKGKVQLKYIEIY